MSLSEATYQSSRAYLEQHLPDAFKPVKLGVICGSGLGNLVNTIDPATKIEFAYKDIPGFVISTVEGHEGKLVFGHLGKSRTPTVFMVGRFHFYEGHTLQQCTLPVRVMKLLGIERLIVTNAAGSLNPLYEPGSFLILNDHISLPGMTGQNPLIGPNINAFGTRFPAVSNAYAFALREIAFRAGAELGLLDDMEEGTYAFVSGPSYETRVEARFLASIGADAVGMSTVPEVIVARHCGIQVLGISLITNSVVTARGRDAKNKVMLDLGLSTTIDNEIDTDQAVTCHQEVLETSARRAQDMQRLVTRIADLIHESSSTLGPST